MPAPSIGDHGYDTRTYETSATNAGALSLTTGVSILTSAGVETRTLAAGTHGQVKVITLKTDGGDVTLTLTGNPAAYDTVVFGDVGDSVMLQYVTGIGWVIVSNNGCAIS